MKPQTLFYSLALVLALASVAAAGGKDGKCSADLGAEAAKMAAKGWIGIDTDKDAATGAVKVKAVAPGSPAEQAGFRVGDVLVAMNGVEISYANQEALKAAKSKLGVGKQVTYTVQRDGARREIAATLAPVPRDVLAGWLGEHLLDSHLTVAVAQSN